MKITSPLAAIFLSACALITGCESTNYPTTASQYPASSASSVSYGVIDSIQTAPVSSGNSVNLGTVAGGVVGGVLGSQIGSGTGRTAATVAGAIGGALVGNKLEKDRQRQTASVYQIGVRLDNGNFQTIQQESVAGLSVGNRVRIENNHVYRY